MRLANSQFHDYDSKIVCLREVLPITDFKAKFWYSSLPKEVDNVLKFPERITEFSREVFDTLPGSSAHEDAYRQGRGYKHILNLVGHVATKRSENHINNLRAVFEKYKHPSYFRPALIEPTGPAWADIEDSDGELSAHKGHPSAVPIAAALKSVVIKYEEKEGSLSQLEVDYLATTRRQHGIIDKAFNVAIPYDHVLINRAVNSIQGGSPKSLARDLVEAAFYIARAEAEQRGTHLEQHAYFMPKVRYIDFEARASRVKKMFGIVVAIVFTPLFRKYKQIIPACALAWIVHRIWKHLLIRFRRKNTIEENFLSERLYEHARNINERRRQQRRKNNEQFLVRPPKKRSSPAPKPINVDQLKEHSIDTVGPTSKLIGTCYCCRRDATFHQEFQDATGIHPSYVVEVHSTGFKATLEARVSEDPEVEPICTAPRTTLPLPHPTPGATVKHRSGGEKGVGKKKTIWKYSVGKNNITIYIYITN